MSLLRDAATVLLAFAGVTVLGACEAILKATSPDRHFDPTIDCSGSECVCKAGLGDCDGNQDNGCETALDDAKNCGGCGVTCTNATCDGSACACAAGFGDCDGDKLNGCETDLTGDQKNCGACHVDCGLGTCVGGFCSIAAQTVPGARSLLDAFGDVYVGSCGAPGPAIVYFTPGHTGSTPAVTDTGCAHAIAAAGTQIAWTSDSAIVLNDIGIAAKGTPLVTGVSPSQLLGGSDTHVYWWDAPSDPTQHALKRAAISSGTTDVLVKGDLTALTADFENAYWSDATGIHSVSHMGTTVSDLAAAQVTALATDPTTLFGGGPGGIVSISLFDGTSMVLAPATQVDGIAAGGNHVYWAEHGDGTVRRVPTDGSGMVTVLASKQQFVSGVPIFVDGSTVFWLSGNELRSVAR